METFKLVIQGVISSIRLVCDSGVLIVYKVAICILSVSVL